MHAIEHFTIGDSTWIASSAAIISNCTKITNICSVVALEQVLLKSIVSFPSVQFVETEDQSDSIILVPTMLQAN